MMKIVKIEWINETAKEAEVTISNGRSLISCFSQPITYQINDVLTDPIYCLNAKNIYKSRDRGSEIMKQGQPFEYFIKGKLADIEAKLVDVDGFKLALEGADLPGDLHDGDIIEFTVSRLDIY